MTEFNSFQYTVPTFNARANAAQCFYCKLPYEDFILDFVIQDNLWKVISPTKDEGGLLCPMCMIKALKELGLPSIHAMIDLTPII